MSEQRTEPTIHCDAPLCNALFLAGDDYVTLDFPDVRLLAFCGAKCLWVWIWAQAQGHWQGLGTQFIEPRNMPIPCKLGGVMNETFEKGLETLINRHSKENDLSSQRRLMSFWDGLCG